MTCLLAILILLTPALTAAIVIVIAEVIPTAMTWVTQPHRMIAMEAENPIYANQDCKQHIYKCVTTK
jgi:hypothetical protein